MLKPVALLGLLALWSVSVQQGCNDLKKSVTHWTYYPIRDMRQTIAPDPQRMIWSESGAPVAWHAVPDSLSVPTIGADPYAASTTPYEDVEKRIFAPPSTDASIAHGDSLFQVICWTCHGKTMAGDGPVAAKFIPPPDLLAEGTRGRTDGFLYMYVRHGGAIMPSYGNAVSSRDTWSLIHYIRHMQRTSPR
jgi:mono/diheme cytochrome c family protein